MSDCWEWWNAVNISRNKLAILIYCCFYRFSLSLSVQAFNNFIKNFNFYLLKAFIKINLIIEQNFFYFFFSVIHVHWRISTLYIVLHINCWTVDTHQFLLNLCIFLHCFCGFVLLLKVEANWEMSFWEEGDVLNRVYVTDILLVTADELKVLFVFGNLKNLVVDTAEQPFYEHKI